MTSTTDTVSGDANYSPGVQLNGGAGVYYISATKTGAGARIFDVIWHCVTVMMVIRYGHSCIAISVIFDLGCARLVAGVAV